MRHYPTLIICYYIFMIINSLNSKERSVTLLDKRTEDTVRKYMPQGSILEGMSTVFTAFADPGRLRIISALSVSEMCVSDLSVILGINQTTLSHQLRFLKSANVVGCKKQGKVVFYYLSRPLIHDLMLIASRLVKTGGQAQEA